MNLLCGARCKGSMGFNIDWGYCIKKMTLEENRKSVKLQEKDPFNFGTSYIVSIKHYITEINYKYVNFRMPLILQKGNDKIVNEKCSRICRDYSQVRVSLLS